MADFNPDWTPLEWMNALAEQSQRFRVALALAATEDRKLKEIKLAAAASRCLLPDQIADALRARGGTDG